MDIRKPKPIHNWRELLTEIGVIVLSVCIALSAEQAVEWWHWRSEVMQARKAILEEISMNQPLFTRRLGAVRCMNRQIAEAHAILDALEAGKPRPGFTTFHRSGGSALLSESEWQSERASQVLTHFPRAELAVLSRYYAQLPDFKSWLGPEGEAWSQMVVLTRANATLATSDLARLRSSLDVAENFGRLLTLNSVRMLELGDQLGIARPVADSARIKDFCEASDERFRSAVGR